MFLEYGNENVRFKYRTIEGSPAQNTVPNELILDGQQRLTSIYSALYSDKPVKIDLYDTKYYSRRNIWGLYRCYNESDSTVLPTYISEIISSRNVYRILWDATSVAYGSKGTCRYHIEDKEFTILLREETIVDSIIEETPPRTDSERFVYSVYKAYKSGEKNAWGSAGIIRSEPIELNL